MTRRSVVYLLLHEATQETPRYFIRVGLGIFWECTSTRADAKEFTSRALAVKTLHRSRKHLPVRH